MVAGLSSGGRMGFKPQNWLVDNLCPYCCSVQLVREGLAINNSGVTCWWYCKECQSRFDVCYEVHALSTERGDEYVIGEPTYKKTLETTSIKQKLLDIKTAINEMIDNC